MPQLILSKGSRARLNVLKKIFPDIELSPYFLVISLVVFVILITVITLVFSTRQVTKGYVLNSLESTHQDLVKENEIKDMEISQVRSLNYIQSSQKVRYMVKPSVVVYLDGDSAIASK